MLLRRLIHLILVATSAIAAEVMLAGSQGYWIVWSALALSLIITGQTFLQRVSAIISFGMLLSVASTAANLSALYTPLFIIVIAMMTMLCVLMAQRKSKYFYAFVVLNLFTLLSGMLPASIPGAIDRGLSILLGMLIAALLQLIFLPGFIRSEQNATVTLLVRYLRKLSEDIFACYLSPAYAKNTYLFERRIHSQKIRCIKILECMRKMDNFNHEIRAVLGRIFESMLAISLLRFRETDESTYGLCAVEINEISRKVDANLAEISDVFRHKNPYINTEALQEKIDLLENNYQTVLKVTAKDPAVFRIFIFNLKSLADVIEEFYALQKTK